jgi:hypothetical protein
MDETYSSFTLHELTSTCDPHLGAVVLPGFIVYWGEDKDRVMLHRFFPLEDQEILCRIRSLVTGWNGELVVDGINE